MNKLSVKGFACAGGCLWGGALLCVALAQALRPDYARGFWDAIASVYPGLGGWSGVGRVVGAALYGATDGAVAGFLFAWLYNRCAD